MKKYAMAFLIAFAARLTFLNFWIWKGLDSVYNRDLYYSLAQSWLGWGPPVAMDATHPPVYTAFIAAILRLSGRHSPMPVMFMQTLLAAAVSPLLLWLGRRLVSERAAWFTALWAAFDPALIFFAPQLQTETLFVFMEMIFFVLFYRLLGMDSLDWLGLGFVGGLAALCRSVFAAYPAFLFPALVRIGGFRRMARRFALLSIGWLIPISVWTARNWMKYHEVIPISAQMGWTLYEGFSTDREEVRRRPYEMSEEAKRLGINDPMSASRYFKAKTFQYMKAYPGESARIILMKALLYWRPWPYDPHPWAIRILLSVYFCALFVLAGYGCWVTRSRLGVWHPVYALFFYLTAMHSLFFTSLRYRLPLEPFLCLWAAAGLDQILRRSQSDKSSLASGSSSQ